MPAIDMATRAMCEVCTRARYGRPHSPWPLGNGSETPARKIAGRRAMASASAHALLSPDVFGRRAWADARRPVMNPGACSTGVFEVAAPTAGVLLRIGGNVG
jgi:hypothetical protein